MARIQGALGEHGRLLVRYSGTEPLVRVMVEGEDESMVLMCAQEVAETLRVHLGV